MVHTAALCDDLFKFLGTRCLLLFGDLMRFQVILHARGGGLVCIFRHMPRLGSLLPRLALRLTRALHRRAWVPD